MTKLDCKLDCRMWNNFTIFFAHQIIVTNDRLKFYFQIYFSFFAETIFLSTVKLQIFFHLSEFSSLSFRIFPLKYILQKKKKPNIFDQPMSQLTMFDRN